MRSIQTHRPHRKLAPLRMAPFRSPWMPSLPNRPRGNPTPTQPLPRRGLSHCPSMWSLPNRPPGNATPIRRLPALSHCPSTRSLPNRQQRDPTPIGPQEPSLCRLKSRRPGATRHRHRKARRPVLNLEQRASPDRRAHSPHAAARPHRSTQRQERVTPSAGSLVKQARSAGNRQPHTEPTTSWAGNPVSRSAGLAEADDEVDRHCDDEGAEEVGEESVAQGDPAGGSGRLVHIARVV